MHFTHALPSANLSYTRPARHAHAHRLLARTHADSQPPPLARAAALCAAPAQAHVAPIMALERSPFFDDIILTVGDWSFQIWREGHTSPLFTSGYASEMYTCGGWRRHKFRLTLMDAMDGWMDGARAVLHPAWLLPCSKGC